MKVLLGVTGSIAAYKAVELLRRCQARRWEVKVIMTRDAQRFVAPLTFQALSRNPVYTEMFPDSGEWRPDHINLGEWPDVFCVAPCSANMLAKLAHGLADDLLSCTALAMEAPLVVAPAMNDRMWLHPATQENCRILAHRGGTFVDVAQGDLACGYAATGRLAAPEDIEACLATFLPGR